MSPWDPKNLPAARRLAMAISANQLEHQIFLEASRKANAAAKPLPAALKPSRKAKSPTPTAVSAV